MLAASLPRYAILERTHTQEENVGHLVDELNDMFVDLFRKVWEEGIGRVSDSSFWAVAQMEAKLYLVSIERASGPFALFKQMARA